MVCGVNARQRWKQVQTIQITILLESRYNEMVYGVNAMQRWKKVRTIQITIVFNQEYRLDGLWS